MKITIEQNEIEQAITDYVHSQVSVKEGQAISIDFTAGRGDKGLSATIDISAPKVVSQGVGGAKQAAPVNTPTNTKPAAQEATTAVSLSDQSEQANDAPPADEADVGVNEGDTSVTEGTVPTGSIFKNLSRPKND